VAAAITIARGTWLGYRWERHRLAGPTRAEDLDDLLLLGLQASRQSLIQRTRRIGSTGVARAMRPDGPLVNLWPVRGAPHARRRPAEGHLAVSGA